MDFVRVLKMVYLQRNNVSEEISLLIRFLKQCERKNGGHLSYQLGIWTNSKNSKPPILTILNLKQARISIMAWIYFHPSARRSHSGARPLRFPSKIDDVSSHGTKLRRDRQRTSCNSCGPHCMTEFW